MSQVFTNALVRFSTTSSTSAAVIGTTTTGGTPEGTGMNDVSDYVMSVKLTRSFDEQDDTVMGMSAHSRTPGLGTWGVELDMIQSFDTSLSINVDKLLNDIIAAKGRVWVSVRACDANRTSDNPEYFGLARLFSHSPADGAVGDLLKTSPAFRSAGSLSRTAAATA